MADSLILLPDIAIDQFLPIFAELTLVLVFAVEYVAIITLSKMDCFSKKWVSLGYLFWVLQTYSFYDVSILVHSNLFTFKVLMVTVVVYLFISYLYFYLIVESDKRYEEVE
jgi:hypothetical protein